ncbi:protein PROCA1 isoform X1 [Myotis daubentonii]|uniref:protein PROCA1 isoform X1 n=1 Tax=Myotis daubentonii TaxID=98922 RepID=UPI0028739D0F|nr:protein PROCA1 isoform X1 [Myotis daubentonii]
MWVRTTMTVERWTEKETEDNANTWDDSSSDVNRLPSWERGHLLAGVASSTDASIFSSEDSDPLGEFKDTDRCCWNHKQCTGHIIHPFTSDCGHYNLHLHSLSHCDCDSRVKDCSEKTNSSISQDVGPTCSRDVGPTCFDIVQTPCFELIPEEEYVERYWYGWCKSFRPVSVAVIHHPLHHEFRDDLNEEEEEEEESKPPIPTEVGPTATTPKDKGIGMGTIMGTSDSAAPITIWRSESPTEKSQGSRVIKKVKKKKEKEKDEEDTDEKAKMKKKVKKGKLTKKKSPVKSEPSPPDLSRSLSPRELVRLSESSPESREDLESEDSYNDPRQEPSSEDIVESSPRKRDKNTVQAKKLGAKPAPIKKMNKRKSPPVSSPNLS